MDAFDIVNELKDLFLNIFHKSKRKHFEWMANETRKIAYRAIHLIDAFPVKNNKELKKQ